MRVLKTRTAPRFHGAALDMLNEYERGSLCADATSGPAAQARTEHRDAEQERAGLRNRGIRSALARAGEQVGDEHAASGVTVVGVADLEGQSMVTGREGVLGEGGQFQQAMRIGECSIGVAGGKCAGNRR